MSKEKQKLGTFGEKLAERYLNKKGWQIIDHNYRKPWGELDLVAKNSNLLLFCEVKTRDAKNVEHYLAEYSIDHLKRRKLQKMCETYLAEKKYPYDQKWQIDVIAISIDKSNKKAKIKHIENAVWEEQY